MQSLQAMGDAGWPRSGACACVRQVAAKNQTNSHSATTQASPNVEGAAQAVGWEESNAGKPSASRRTSGRYRQEARSAVGGAVGRKTAAQCPATSALNTAHRFAMLKVTSDRLRRLCG